MANANFTISGSPSAGRGYDATHGEVLQLQLEDQPSLDVFKAQYKIGQITPGAPTPTFSTALGIATPPNGIVELTMPGSGIHDYEVVCEVNDGKDAEGNVRPEYTFSRVVAIRSNEGLRKIFAAETTEYDPNQGWATAINEMVEEIDTLAGGIGGTVQSVTGTSPIVVDNTDPQNPIVGLNLEIEGIEPIVVDASDPINPKIMIDPATTLAAGSMSAADKTKLDDATASPTPNTLVLRDGAGGLTADYFQSDAASLPSAGVIRSGDGEVILASRDDADTTDVNLVSWGVSAADELDIGSTFVDAINMSVKATKPFRWLDDGASFLSLTKADGFKFADGSTLAVTYVGAAAGGTGSSAIVEAQAGATAGGNLILRSGLGAASGTIRLECRSTGNISLGSSGPTFGGGELTLFIPNATTPPSSNPTNGVIAYVEGGVLKSRDPSGIVTPIAPNWTQTALLTANHTASAWEHVLLDFGGASSDIEITLPASSMATKNARVKVSEVSADGGVGAGYALKILGTIATTAGGSYVVTPYIVANNGFGASKVGAWIELIDTGAGWLPVGIGCAP